jgi:hypothetical protein
MYDILILLAQAFFVLMLPIALGVTIFGIFRTQKKTAIIGVLILLISGFAVLQMGKLEVLKIDRCLDQGHRYDYGAKQCRNN